MVKACKFVKICARGAKDPLSLAPMALQWREHSRCCLRHTFKSWQKNVYNSLVQLLPCICSNSLRAIPQSTVKGCLSYLIQLPCGSPKAMSDSQPKKNTSSKCLPRVASHVGLFLKQKCLCSREQEWVREGGLPLTPVGWNWRPLCLKPWHFEASKDIMTN